MPSTCSCGLFAEGLCAACAEPACTRHGRFIHDEWLCREHAAEARSGPRAYALMAAGGLLFVALVAVLSSALR